MKLFKIFFKALFFLLPLAVSANDTLSVGQTNQRSIIGNSIKILEDPDDNFTIEQVLKRNDFKKSNSSIVNLGTTKSTYWLHFTFQNTSTQKMFLEIYNPTVDFSEVYVYSNSSLVNKYEIDENISYAQRPYPDRNIICLVSEANDASVKEVYVKIKSTKPLVLPIFLSSSVKIYEAHNNDNLFFGIYLGIIFVMFFYNIFIYISVKDSSYLYYVIYIFFVGMTQAALKGFIFQYLFPDSPVLASRTILVFPCLTGIFAILFMRKFILTETFTPKQDKGLLAIIGVYMISLLLAVLNYQHISYMIVDGIGLIASIFIIYTTAIIIRKGYRPAKFFMYSWSLFLSAVLLFVLRGFGILPFNPIMNNILEIGSALEVILLSFALADRINILKVEKEESQIQVVNALRENERIIKEQNVILESKVNTRTSELKKSNDELTTTLTELKQTQSQLVNAEKMASLGQLTAGIAHEINNPINFVVSNIKPLQRDIDDIYELVKKYESFGDGKNIEDKIKDIEQFRKEMDYDYVKEEISNLLKGMEVGASRTADIVKGLRVFSRLDETDIKRTNIVDGIESTLTLLNPEISGSMELVKNFSNTPEIECYPGKMNQVFMNILNNAIFAIKAHKDRTEKGKLEITTYVDEQFVCVSIKDNGIGMSDDVKNKVFDPFFTTKDVGKGTGLGMSITFSIIKDHNGTIDILSEVGKGTEFIIKLPINQLKK